MATADLTVLATETLTRKSLSDSDHQKLVEESPAPNFPDALNDGTVSFSDLLLLNGAYDETKVSMPEPGGTTSTCTPSSPPPHWVSIR